VTVIRGAFNSTAIDPDFKYLTGTIAGCNVYRVHHVEPQLAANEIRRQSDDTLLGRIEYVWIKTAAIVPARPGATRDDLRNNGKCFQERIVHAYGWREVGTVNRLVDRTELIEQLLASFTAIAVQPPCSTSRESPHSENTATTPAVIQNPAHR
jgi:hypothetical protein